jgi:hypothetical protein
VFLLSTKNQTSDAALLLMSRRLTETRVAEKTNVSRTWIGHQFHGRTRIRQATVDAIEVLTGDRLFAETVQAAADRAYDRRRVEETQAVAS